MSTVKAVNFQHPSSAAANLTLAADGTVTGGLPAGGRNLLYNGAMQVAQRGTSTAAVTTGYYTADRWATDNTSLGTWTQSVENDAPTGSGLRKSLKMLCTAADASPGAGDYCLIGQYFEGQDLQRIAKGTGSAKELTVSFWVKANTTGNYVVALYDNDNNRYISASYAISASAAWEQKKVTFAADTTGAFDNDNAQSLRLWFWLGAGSGFSASAAQTTWGTYSNGGAAVGQTNLAAATNNYWQITGVQLEVGPVASAFEFKPFGRELRECQRYYYRQVAGTAYAHFAHGNSYNTASAVMDVYFPVTMRAVPTSIDTSNLRIDDNGTGFSITSITLTSYSSSHIGQVATGGSSGLTAYRPHYVSANNNAAAYLAFSAEL